MTTYKEIHGKAIRSVSSNLSDSNAEGQIWYNDSTNNFKTILPSEAWSSAANTLNSKQRPGGCGTQLAGLICGGFNAPPNGAAFNGTEEYNGSGWASGGTLNTARGNTKLVGIQTSAVYFGQGGGSSPGYTGVTEEYNGTAWTTVNPMTYAVNYRSGCGVENALLATAGNYPSTNRTDFNEEYDGTNWTNGAVTPQRQSSQGQAGTQTAAINSFGYTNSPIPGTGGDAQNAISLEYNGTGWTAGPNGNGVVPISGYAMGSGTQTNAIFAGGPPTNSCKYDGTTFTVGPALGTAQESSAHGSTSASATWIAQGSPVPTVGSKSQEFNSSVNVVTAGAFSSGGNLPQISRGGGSAGTQDAAWYVGGLQYPSDTKNRTDEYNGSSWTNVNNLPANTFMGGACGSLTAGLIWGSNAGYGVEEQTYEYDGTNWTAGGSLPDIGPAYGSAGGGGTQTAAVACGGYGDPPPGVANVVEYNGASWTANPNSLPTGNYDQAGDGTATALWLAGGYLATTTTLHFNGTSFSTSGSLNQPRQYANAAGYGTQTNAIVAGGDPSYDTQGEQYNGTAWVTAPSLSQGRKYGLGASRSAGSKTGFIAGGATPPGTNTNNTEEFTPETTAVNIKTLTQS